MIDHLDQAHIWLASSSICQSQISRTPNLLLARHCGCSPCHASAWLAHDMSKVLQSDVFFRLAKTFFMPKSSYYAYLPHALFSFADLQAVWLNNASAATFRRFLDTLSCFFLYNDSLQQASSTNR